MNILSHGHFVQRQWKCIIPEYFGGEALNVEEHAGVPLCVRALDQGPYVPAQGYILDETLPLIRANFITKMTLTLIGGIKFRFHNHFNKKI